MKFFYNGLGNKSKLNKALIEKAEEIPSKNLNMCIKLKKNDYM